MECCPDTSRLSFITARLHLLLWLTELTSVKINILEVSYIIRSPSREAIAPRFPPLSSVLPVRLCSTSCLFWRWGRALAARVFSHLRKVRFYFEPLE